MYIVQFLNKHNQGFLFESPELLFPRLKSEICYWVIHIQLYFKEAILMAQEKTDILDHSDYRAQNPITEEICFPLTITNWEF